jgi:hypothetical protein
MDTVHIETNMVTVNTNFGRMGPDRMRAPNWQLGLHSGPTRVALRCGRQTPAIAPKKRPRQALDHSAMEIGSDRGQSLPDKLVLPAITPSG